MAEPTVPVAWLTPYWRLLRAQWRAQASYRGSFGIDLVSSVWATVFDVVAVLVMFRVTSSLGGFNLREVLVMVGLSAAGFATADLVAGNIEKLRGYVRTGQLDMVLVRPLAVLPQLVLHDLQLRLLGRVVVGAGTLIAALALAPVEWNLPRLLLAVIAPLAAAAFFVAIFVASASVAFWWVETGELASAVTYGGRDLTAYPMTVYGGLFRRLFGFVLGFALVTYYPALALLDRPDPLGAPGWLGWVAPAVALPASAVAWLVWRAGIRHYRSTGS